MRDGHQTKQLIDRTALKLFVEQGIAETTIKDISRAAGIAEGALYRHYPSKDALAWELFSRNYMAWALELQELERREATFPGKLASMIRYFCRLFDEDPVMFSYLLLAQHDQVKKVTAEVPSPVRVVREVITGAMERGEIPPGDPWVLTAMGLGVVLEVAEFKIYGRITDSLTSLSDALVKATFRVLQLEASL